MLRNSPHLQYASYIVRHKYFVFKAGRKLEVPLWRLIIHDWSKFTHQEWSPYVNSFYTDLHVTVKKPPFDKAWLHHIHWNKHHWQYWVLHEDEGGFTPLPMPEKYVREMVADWMGAGRAITGRWDVIEWYTMNRNLIVLHPDSRHLAEELLRYAINPEAREPSPHADP